ncbi:MAG: penicillin-binding protein 1C [Bacteroidales bacterium]|jgi:penicillin-binding protein 1C|nr:penicillin-binding protein 1C [Bacteroidales bacterium]
MKKILLITAALGLALWYIFCLSDKIFDVPYSTVVTDSNGEMLGARIADDMQWRFPECDSVPQKYQICVTKFEDKYYRYHWGVNPFAICRAALQNIKKGRIVSGGSTITMQVIRLSRQNSRTYFEKFIEVILATRLEFRYSKDKILRLYASHAPFGGNVVGLDAAMWRYFGHSADKITWAEAATLAVLPNSPSMAHILKNREQLLAKRNRLLKQLLDENIIDSNTYDLALSEELPDKPIPLPQHAPHLVDCYYRYNRGKNIRSSINRDLQRTVEDILARWNYEFKQKQINNLAAIVFDVENDKVVAYCGNVNYEKNVDGNKVDIIRSERSTGSILKPFLYYAALDEGDILPKTLLPDIPIFINGFSPQNFNMSNEGAVSANEALARSLNIPMVILLRNYGVPKFYNFLKSRGISSLPNPSSHYGLSLILGGAEASLWNVANAYKEMARSLVSTEKSETWNKGAVWQVFEAMKEVSRYEEIDWKNIPSMQTVAWKTGTSYGFRDAWAVGITPKYVVGVWAGNSSGEGMAGLVGVRTAAPVMFDIIEALNSNCGWFECPYNEFALAEVCKQSGNLKGRYCVDVSDVLVLQHSLQTADACEYHKLINLTADGKYRVYDNCANSEPTVQKEWFVLPPSWEHYYRRHHPEYKTLPPFKQGCGDNGLPMQFIYPHGNTVIHLPRQLDGTDGEIVLQVAHSNKDATLYWHIDKSYIASTKHIHQLSVALPLGKHNIVVEDNAGHIISCAIEVE